MLPDRGVVLAAVEIRLRAASPRPETDDLMASII